MIRLILVCIINGMIFGILDGLINANPMARKLFETYKPISKDIINVPAGIIIDLIYGFVMGFVFLLLYNSLPGSTGVVKGLSFGTVIWFFRVFMNIVTTWMTLKIPVKTLIYTGITGLLEMMVIGLIYGLFLKTV